MTRRRNPQAEAQFLIVLRRWAGKFSPWVSDQPPASLVVDLTGCAHLFGGEVALIAEVEEDCEAMGLTVHAGIGDSVGAAWALARFAGQPEQMARTGDAVDQEARATRARAVKRRNWERGGPAPKLAPPGLRASRIAAPGQARTVLAPLPVAALRIDADTATALARLGLRRIGDLTGMPRAALARRFGDRAGAAAGPGAGAGVRAGVARPPAAAFRGAADAFPTRSGWRATCWRRWTGCCRNWRSGWWRRGAARGGSGCDCFRTDQAAQWAEVGLARAARPRRTGSGRCWR